MNYYELKSIANKQKEEEEKKAAAKAASSSVSTENKKSSKTKNHISGYNKKAQDTTPTTPKSSSTQPTIKFNRASSGSSSTSSTTSEKWYKGELPTTGEILGRGKTVSQTNAEEGAKIISGLRSLQLDPSSSYYSPFIAPTNRAVSDFASLGGDSSKIDSNFFRNNAYLKNYYIFDGTTNTPSKPGKKDSAEAQLAYQYYQIEKSEPTTVKAEEEWQAVKDHINFEVSRTDRNRTDDEIIATLDWSDYPTLSKMLSSASTGTPIELNRPVGFTMDNLYGVIWAARNGDTGNDEANTASYYLGEGKGYVENAELRAKLDPTNPDYNPYAVGSTMESACRYFKTQNFSGTWVNDKRELMSDPESKDYKNYISVSKAEDTTVAIETESKNLMARADKYIARYGDPETALKHLKEDYENGDVNGNSYSTLKKVDESLAGKRALLDTTRAVDYRWQDVELYVRDAYASAAPTTDNSAAVTGSDVTETDKAAVDAADLNTESAAGIMEETGTEEEKDRFDNAPSASYGITLAGTHVRAPKRLEVISSIKKSCKESYTNAFLENYETVFKYEEKTQELQELHIQRADLVASIGGEFMLDEPGEVVANDPSNPGMEIHLAYNDYDGVYEFDYAVDKNNDNNVLYFAGDAGDYVFKMIEDANAKEAERQSSVSAAMAELSFPEQVDIIEAKQKIKELDIAIEDDNAYISNYTGAYIQSRDAMSNSTLDLIAGIRDIEAKGGDPTDLMSLSVIMDYAYQMGADYVPTTWATSNLYQQSLAQGSSMEEVVAAAGSYNEAAKAELEEINFIQEFMQTSGVKLPGAYTKNINRRKARLERDMKDYEYFMLQTNEDFDEYVQKGYEIAKGSAWSGTLAGEIESGILYHGADKSYYMTDDEKKTYMYLFGKEGEQAADRYYDHLNDGTYGVIPTRMTNKIQIDMAQITNPDTDSGLLSALGFVGGNALAVLMSPAKAAGAIYAVSAAGTEINPNSPYMIFSNASSAAMEASSAAIDEQFGEGTFMSTLAHAGYEIVINRLNSLVTGAVFSPITGAFSFGSEIINEIIQAVPMAMGAAADTVVEAKRRGASDEQAYALGGVALIAESFSEGITWGNLKSDLGIAGSTLNAVTIKDVVKDWITKSGFEEMIGESVTEIVETVADNMVMQDKSQHAMAVYEYRMAGMSLEDAEAKATADEAFNVMRTALISYLSPGLDVFVRSASTVRESRKIQKITGNMSFSEAKNLYYAALNSKINSSDDTTAAPPVAGSEGVTEATVTPAADTTTTTEGNVIPVAGTAGSAPATTETTEAPVNIYDRDMALLNSLGVLPGMDSTTRAATMTTVLGSEGTASVFGMPDDMASAAAVKLHKLFGNGKNAPKGVQRLLSAAVHENIPTADVKTAIMVAAITGDESSAAYAVMKTDEYKQADPGTRAMMLVNAAAKDLTNPELIQKVNTKIHENRVAEAEQQLIQQGFMEEAVKEDEKVKSADDSVRAANEELQKKQDEQQAKQDAVAQAGEAFTQDPGNDVAKNELSHAVADLTHASQVTSEYRQKADNTAKTAEETKAGAKKFIAQKKAELRAQAEKMVAEVDATRQAIAEADLAAQQAVAAKAAEEQLAKDIESGKLEDEADAKTLDDLADEIAQKNNLSPEMRDRVKDRLTKNYDSIKLGSYNPQDSISTSKAKKILGNFERKLGIKIVVGDTGIGRGKYENGVITISEKLNIGQAVVEVAMHEITHSLEQTKSYESYASTALDSLYGGRGTADYRAAIDNKILEYKRNGATLDEKGAEKELVAEFTRTKLSDDKTIQRLLNNGLGGKIKNALHNINQYIKNIKLDGEEKKQAEYLRKAESALTRAMRERRKTEIHPSAAQFSVPQLAQSLGAYYDEITGTMFDSDPSLNKNAKPVTEFTADMIRSTPMGKMIDVAENGLTKMKGKGKNAKEVTVFKPTISKETAQKQREMFAGLANMCLKYKDSDLVWEIASSTLSSNLSAIKNNADPQYGNTVDFGTVCAKTQAIIDALSDVMQKRAAADPNFSGLTRQDVMTVYDRVSAANLSVPCPVCYVFSRWMGVPSLLGKISSFQRNYVVTDADGKIDNAATQAKADAYIKAAEKKYGSPKEINNTKSKLTNKIKNAENNRIMYAEQAEFFKSGRTQQYIKHLLDNAEQLRGLKQNTKAEALEKKAKALEKKFAKCKSNEDIQSVNAKLAAEAQKNVDKNIAKMDAAEKELSNVEAYNWITQTLCKEEDGKFVVDPEFEITPNDVLFDLNKTGEFSKYTKNWAYRNTRGAGMGKAILPYSGESIGDVISGVDRQLGDNNPWLAESYDPVAAATAMQRAYDKARRQNLVGGQRLQSTSDFRPEWGLDYMMTFLEMQAIQSHAQLYTKVLEAVDLFASVGADVNISLMGRGSGWYEDETGKHLDFSNITGADFELAREKARNNDNVQMILVGMNDDHIRLAINGDDIDFVIPWHSSGNGRDTLSSLLSSVGEMLNESTDYTEYQNDKASPKQTAEQKKLWELRTKIINGKGESLTEDERRIVYNDKDYLAKLYDRFYVEGVDEDCFGVALPKNQAEQIFPYEYWDTSLRKEEAQKNGEAFVKYCEHFGMIPRFEQFKGEKGYWKLLIDRKMYDKNGNYRKQQAIDVTNAKIGSLEQGPDGKYSLQNSQLPTSVATAKYGSAYQIQHDQAVQESLEVISQRYNGQTQFSMADDMVTDADIDQMLAEIDAEYFENVSDVNSYNEKAMEDVNAIAEMNGFDTAEVAYHGSDNFGFAEFDMDRSQNQIFVAYNKDLSRTYITDEYTPEKERIHEYSVGTIKMPNIDGMSDEDAINVIAKHSDENNIFDGFKIRYANETIQNKISGKRKQAVDEMTDAVKKCFSDGGWSSVYDSTHTSYVKRVALLILNEDGFGVDPDTLNNQISGAIEKYDLDSMTPLELAEKVLSLSYEEDGSSVNSEAEDLMLDMMDQFDTDDYYQAFDDAFFNFSELRPKGGFLLGISLGLGIDVAYVVDAPEFIDVYKSRINNINKRHTPGIYEFYTRPGRQLVVDAGGANWAYIPWEGTTMRTRELAEWGRANGYDSVRINNVYDHGPSSRGVYNEGYGDIAIFFNKDDVKSADPVTVDDAGNIIPPSERFSSSPDLRYQIGGEMTDADIDQMITSSGVNIPATMSGGEINEPSSAVNNWYKTNHPGTNPYPKRGKLKSGQTVIADTMERLGFTADSRSSKYLASHKKTTLGYTFSDRVAHIKDAQNVLVAMHELGHIFDKELGMQSMVPGAPEWNTMEQNYKNKIDPDFLSSYKPSEVRGELMAEFTAAYVTGRENAVDLAGEDFVKSFESALKEKGWLKDFTKSINEARAWLDSTAEAQVRALDQMELHKPEKIWQPETYATNIFDKTLPLLRITNEMKAAGQYSPDTDPRTLRLAQTSMVSNLTNACLTERLLTPEGEPVKNANGDEMGSLKDILSKVSIKDEGAFNDYWLLLHAKDRAAAGKQAISGTVDIDAALQSISSKHTEFYGIVQEAVEWYNSFMKSWLVDTGLLKKSEFETMKSMYPHYVPTFRSDEDFNKALNHSGFGRLNEASPSSPLRGAHKSTANIYNPVMSMVEYVQKYINYAKQVESLRAFSNAADRLWNKSIGTGGLVGIAEPYEPSLYSREVDTTDHDATILRKVDAGVKKTLKDNAGDVDAENIIMDTYQNILDKLQNISDHTSLLQKTPDGEDVINVPMSDGSTRSWTVYNKAVFDALVSAPPNKRSRAIRAVGSLTGLMCSMCTGRSIPFTLHNFASDSETAMNTGHNGLIRSTLPGYVLSQFATAGDYLVNRIKDTTGKGQTSKAYDDFKVFGLMGSRFLFKDKSTQKQMRKELYGKTTSAKVASAANAMLNPVHIIENVSEFLEEVTRYNEFKHDRTNTSDYGELLEAGKNSREVTTDFSKSGSMDLGNAKAFIPFLGASLQGVYKTLRMFSSENAGNRVKTAARILINGTLTSMLMAMAKNLTWDPEDKEAYDDMSAYEANKYWHLKIGDGKFIKVKRSQDGIIQLADAFGTFLGNTFTGNEDNVIGDFVDVGKEILKNIVPGFDNVISPITDALNNKTWYDSPIDSSSVTDRSILGRVSSKTTKLSEVIASTLALIGLEDKLSPAQVEYIIGQYTGSLGAIGSSTFKALTTEGNKGEAMWKVFRDNIADKFVHDSVYSNAIASEYYSMKEIVSSISSEYGDGIRPKKVRSSFTDEEVEEISKEAKNLLSTKGTVGRLYKEYKAYKKEYDEINNDDTLPLADRDARTREIKKEMNKILLEANEELSSFLLKYCYTSTQEEALMNMVYLLGNDTLGAIKED